ncbi:MAG: fumarate lyase [Candidatus Saccharibacteria bacterium]|nr:fumarate lyase [Candidatus Saccharibacteria bacterium]
MKQLAPIVLPETSDARNYDSIDPLDNRYYDIEIGHYLSERSRVAYQAYVEAALANTLADYGVCSQEIADEIAIAASKVTTEEVYAEEKTTRHDIKALVNVIKSKLSEDAQPYVHFGATSHDVIGTASSLQMKDAMTNVVIPRLTTLLRSLAEMSEKYADTVQVGRTHGQHAVPITFGFAIAEYVSRLGQSLEIIQKSTDNLFGKFSGAVGSYNALSVFIDNPEEFEEKIVTSLGLKVAPYSTQIIPAENVVRLLDELSLAAGIMSNLAHDMRHLQRTEIGEVRERFEPGQTGSSTMAHKRNPWNFENVVSMWKQVTAQTINARLNISSEHQRDLTDSASSRFYVIIPASVVAMATRLNTIMNKLEVDEENMQRNLKLTGGAIAAEPLYLLFEKYGHTTAHEKSKALAHSAMESNTPLVEVITADAEALEYWNKFTDNEKQIISEPEKYYIGRAAEKARRIAQNYK